MTPTADQLAAFLTAQGYQLEDWQRAYVEAIYLHGARRMLLVEAHRRGIPRWLADAMWGDPERVDWPNGRHVKTAYRRRRRNRRSL